jgi:hypothetical protein
MLVGARYYDAQVGVFISRDTLLNQLPYVYCDGNPVNTTDPSGHQTPWGRSPGGIWRPNPPPGMTQSPGGIYVPKGPTLPGPPRWVGPATEGAKGLGWALVAIPVADEIKQWFDNNPDWLQNAKKDIAAIPGDFLNAYDPHDDPD